ncbi:hypothetical protein G7083_09365 [Vibrio sp. HDW18]|uniref:hypothetical protein n=1 Tax=Vibrio sp. HDW18 TaxID=2714948 RepID=UPI00140BFB0E|nr:hypothetical protein [Vibrio sp. HDW18]QIL86038.1 hypothetical protein G7083_09365 [Vibrio sp. HDW18]
MSISTNRRSAEHLELIFEIYSLIPTTRKITVREIHQALTDKGIVRTKRTVQRYLDSLLNYFDIEQDTRSQPYGYRRKITTKLTFSPCDHMMFSWAELSLKALLPKSYHEIISQAFIAFNAPESKSLPIDIRLSAPNDETACDDQVFETLCLAVFYQREVRLTLINQPTCLYINPLGFILDSNGLYLVYQFQEQFHVITLANVVSAYLTTFAYHYPPQFSLKDIQPHKRK